METRVRNLEAGHAVVVERLSGFEKRVDERFDSFEKRVDERFDSFEKRVDNGFTAVNNRIDDLGKKVDRLPNEWSMAKVVFFVIGGLMAAAYFAPRLLAMLPTAQ